MADELIEVMVLKRSDKGTQELTGFAPSADCPIAIFDASQGEDPERAFERPWNVTHRATGMAMPRTWSASKEDALEYLEELLTVKGWDKVRVTMRPEGRTTSVKPASRHKMTGRVLTIYRKQQPEPTRPTRERGYGECQTDRSTKQPRC